MKTIAEPKFDAIDEAILDKRFARFIARGGPAVGDYVIMPDGDYRRFTYDWGDDIQTTSGCGNESFYLTAGGAMDYSGGLDDAIPKAQLIHCEEYKPGTVWFFHHDDHRAHNGVYVQVPCRVYRFYPKPAWPKCDACGMVTEKVIGCPDGAEICQRCFDLGKH